MENPTPEQLKKLEKLQNVAEQGDIAVTMHLFELEEKLDREIPQIKDIIGRMKGDKGDKHTNEEMLELIQPLIPEQVIPEDGHTPTREELLSLIKPLIPEKAKDGLSPTTKELLNLIEPLMPDATDVASIASTMALETLKPLIPTISQLENNIPQLGERIRDALELLKEDERLDASAIKGLEKYIEGKIKIPEIQRVVGANRYLYQLLDMKLEGIQTGQSIIWDGVSWIPYTPGSGGSYGTYDITGTINDSNVNFTSATATALKEIVINGSSYRPTGGIYTFTQVGTAITLNQAIGSSSVIYGRT